MNTHVDCISCVINKANSLADKYIDDKKEKYKFMNKVLKEISKISYEKTAPYLVSRVMRILQDFTGIKDFYKTEKDLFNDKMLSMENKIEQIIDKSDNKFDTALKIALAGNIIDFGAFDEITFDMVQEIIYKTLECKFDDNVYEKFKNDLSKSKKLVYLGDNTGEIVFDKIFIREMKLEFNNLDIYFVTRGEPILNDVTIEDAYTVGMDKYAKIISNGTDLPGTDLSEVSEEFKKEFNDADIIISKGQGNFESLPGCAKNVYYLFLCKCDLIVKLLKTERLAHVFIHENSIK